MRRVAYNCHNPRRFGPFSRRIVCISALMARQSAARREWQEGWHLEIEEALALEHEKPAVPLQHRNEKAGP